MLRARTIFIGVLLCCAVAATVLTQARGGLVGAEANDGSSAGMVSLAPFGMRFTPQPTDRAAITKSQAIAAAMGRSVAAQDGHLLANVQVNAQYGLYSDDRMATLLPSGQEQLLYQNRPAWVVTFAGPGVVIHPIGQLSQHPGGATDTSASTAVHNEQSIVIDAETGAYLLTFS